MKQLLKEELKSGRKKSKSRKLCIASITLLYFQVVHCFDLIKCFRKM